MPNDGPVLEYAADAPRRWRWRRWMVVSVPIVIVGLVLTYREPIAKRARVLYWQQRCLTYTRPPGTPVATAQAVMDTDPDYLQSMWGRSGAVLLPECWRMYERQTRRVRTPSWVSGTGNVPPTVFLHERVSPSGHRRLIRVESIYANAMRPEVGYTVTVIAPGSLWREPKDVGPRYRHSYSGQFVQAELFFGQPDRNDASHFMIDFAVEGKPRGIVDGWLQDDDTVVFKLRDPASTQGL